MYLNKFDQMEVELQNMAKKLANRENNTKKRIREEVTNYLKELQND